MHRTIGGHWNAQSQPRGSRHQGGVTLHSCWDWIRRCGSMGHRHSAATSCLLLQHEVQPVVDEGMHVQAEEVLSYPWNQTQTFIPWIGVQYSALFAFHAITGCDTVSYFSGHTKKTAMSVFVKCIGYFSTSEKETSQRPSFTMQKSSSVSCTMLRTWQRQMRPECNCLTNVRRSR